jgi:hypothetical protein
MHEFKLEKNSYNQLSSLAIAVMPILLYFIPIEWLNKQPSICLFKNIFGLDCYGCGITRAIISGVQLNLQGALEYNQMIVLVLPLLTYIWIKTVMSLIKRDQFISKDSK